MSGHSKWSQIKRQKGVNDSKRGKIYTKVANQIVASVRVGGADENANFALKMALSKARNIDMPQDSIQRAIKKALGEGKSGQIFEHVTYEAYGFGGAVLIIDALTENRSRTAAEVRLLVEKNGGKIVGIGSLSWQFHEFGLITLTTESTEEKREKELIKWNKTINECKILNVSKIIDDFQFAMMDVEGVQDIVIENDMDLSCISIYTNSEKLDYVRKIIAEKKIAVEQVELIKKPESTIVITEEEERKNQDLIDLIEGYDDVENIWTNISFITIS